MSAAVMECPDFSEFQETLKTMRKADDIIVNTINSTVPTTSFHADESTACKSIYEQIQEGHIKRENYIKNCISYTSSNVQRLKNEREKKSDDIQLSKLLRGEQTKLRMLQVELSVEDLIKERSLKVFNDKCRKYFKPPS
ncbi:protein MIX23 [Anthonomus grandis grandis]|uniref:protein MIX23 n=1 Tax=Anthonomus grandis grandis TaxID=2921223 RepID=UPI002166425A|nr:protein MIX23 [Anthonomus grandis grandis]